MADKMIQPEPDAPCQYCGLTEHPEPIRVGSSQDCPHCHGIHYGSYFCPYSETQPGRVEVPWPKASPESPRATTNFMRQLPGGICFAHGPYTEMQCPKWPACATDPQNDEYKRMGMAQVADSRPTITADELIEKCATEVQKQRDFLLDQNPDYFFEENNRLDILAYSIRQMKGHYTLAAEAKSNLSETPR